MRWTVEVMRVCPEGSRYDEFEDVAAVSGLAAARQVDDRHRGERGYIGTGDVVRIDRGRVGPKWTAREIMDFTQQAAEIAKKPDARMICRLEHGAFVWFATDISGRFSGQGRTPRDALDALQRNVDFVWQERA